ncbi:MAG: neutral/alkaline non-lysosomal ceramidase N-terminal domain-containing protein [Clostridia bacterium]|nr:neutral/alkaline non-lysosomal ceramidase N-terminal domain-containing protein [Clostridia bacterium]
MNNKLLLGIAREIITPEIGGNLYGYNPNIYSESVNDDLTATAFAFSQNEKTAIMISITVCGVANYLQEEIRKEINEKTGVPFGNIILAATHTHSAPNTSGGFGWGEIDIEYVNGIFRPAIVKVGVDAFNNLQPVTVASAVGKSYVGINRRELNENNDIVLGQNPWGPFNPDMTVISFKNEEDAVVGNIISYGCHGTSAGLNHEVTRDWPGYMTDAVETVSGGITAFFNGPEGDVGPRLSNGKTIGNIKLTAELGAIAASDALKIYNSLPEYADVDFDVFDGQLNLPLLPKVSLEEAEKWIAEYEGKDTWPLAKRRLLHYKEVKKAILNGDNDNEYRPVPQSLIKLGNVVFASCPYELFSEINLRIQKEVKDYNVIVLSNANGIGGYFPTQSELCRLGYEILMFFIDDIQCYTDDADYQFIKETIKNIEKIK